MIASCGWFTAMRSTLRFGADCAVWSKAGCIGRSRYATLKRITPAFLDISRALSRARRRAAASIDPNVRVADDVGPLQKLAFYDLVELRWRGADRVAAL